MELQYLLLTLLSKTAHSSSVISQVIRLTATCMFCFDFILVHVSFVLIFPPLICFCLSVSSLLIWFTRIASVSLLLQIEDHLTDSDDSTEASLLTVEGSFCSGPMALCPSQLTRCSPLWLFGESTFLS